MIATETTTHLERDVAGVLRVRDKGYKVILLVGDHVDQGWDAAEIQSQHPDLTLGEIHSVLAYYYDHAEELRQELAERERSADALLREFDRAGKLRAIR